MVNPGNVNPNMNPQFGVQGQGNFNRGNMGATPIPMPAVKRNNPGPVVAQPIVTAPQGNVGVRGPIVAQPMVTAPQGNVGVRGPVVATGTVVQPVIVQPVIHQQVIVPGQPTVM